MVSVMDNVYQKASCVQARKQYEELHCTCTCTLCVYTCKSGCNEQDGDQTHTCTKKHVTFVNEENMVVCNLLALYDEHCFNSRFW